MDALWLNIVAVVQSGAGLFDHALTPLHRFGPLFILSLLALGTVLVTKLLNRIIVTRRYIELEKEFRHWYAVREEAMKCEDYEKAKRLARNIDQAKLNRVYYDYFLEGFLLGLIRNVLPIILMVAFINEYFRAERLAVLFNRDYVLKFSGSSGQPVLLGSVFCYIVALLAGYLLWLVAIRLLRRRKQKSSSNLTSMAGEPSC